MRKLLLLALFVPVTAFAPAQPTAQDRMLQRQQIERAVERERSAWRDELLRHEQDCRRERDRINREHQERIRQIEQRRRRIG